MAAARKKGKYIGGQPILGYDVDRSASRLVVNAQEAARVRQIFALYLERQSLLATIAELDQRDWVTKRWTTQKGKQRGGKPFTKNSLHSLLTNITYVGKVRYKDDVYPGEHEALVDPEVFERVQRLLARNFRSGGTDVRNRYGALLKGLLYCVPCGCSMTHTYASKRGKTRYRYYVCARAQKRGWSCCPSKSVPAAEIEAFVVDQIRSLGRDPALVAETLAQVRRQIDESLAELRREEHGIQRELLQAHAELRRLASGECMNAHHLADLNERVRVGEQRLKEIAAEHERLKSDAVDERDVAAALAEFDPVWEQLSLREQARVLQLLIERVEYDGTGSTIAVTFRPSGFQALANELETEEAGA